MKLSEVISQLLELEVKLQALQAEKKALIESVDGVAKVKRVVKKKSKKGGWSYYARQKAAKLHKAKWEALSATEKQAIIAKRLAGRKGKPLVKAK